ncbi:hypothetical protein [Actinomadura sp. WAC 06369]|uniref:hypothetical protein n=1 Tax=Actinomadura sp. WAC 06369 TaxID=2203193 RepID=UPI0013153117|nr:hypothetical protein [Actinomadura sp. WAC 06369]
MTEGMHGRRLTAAQYDVWLGRRLGAPGAAHHVAALVEIAGPVDAGRLADAVRAAVVEAGLHAAVRETRDGPRLVPPPDGPEVPVVDLRDEADPDAAARAWTEAERSAPAGPLAQAVLRTAGDRCLWYQRYDPVLLDCHAVPPLERRAARIYTALTEGTPAPPSPFPAPADVLAEEDAYRDSPDRTRDREHWTTLFADRPGRVGVGSGRVGGGGGTCSGDRGTVRCRAGDGAGRRRGGVPGAARRGA